MSDIVVTCLPEAIRALEAARRDGQPVTLHSQPSAARTLGPGYFREMIRLARQAVPDVPATAILDCGDAPGLALAALAAGVEAVRIAAGDEVAARIADIARQSGAQIYRTWPEPFPAGLDAATPAVTELP